VFIKDRNESRDGSAGIGNAGMARDPCDYGLERRLISNAVAMVDVETMALSLSNRNWAIVWEPVEGGGEGEVAWCGVVWFGMV
jgi:hypothetical protein